MTFCCWPLQAATLNVTRFVVLSKEMSRLSTCIVESAWQELKPLVWRTSPANVPEAQSVSSRRDEYRNILLQLEKKERRREAAN